MPNILLSVNQPDLQELLRVARNAVADCALHLRALTLGLDSLEQWQDAHTIRTLETQVETVLRELTVMRRRLLTPPATLKQDTNAPEEGRR